MLVRPGDPLLRQRTRDLSDYPLAKLRWAAQDERDKRKRMAAMKEDAERDLLAFVRMCWPIIEPETPLVEGWLMDMMCDVLMAVSYGDLTRVCINVPPGSSKSTLLNVMLPAWEWGPCNRPSLRYLSISYSTIVPVRDNLRFSQIIQHPVYKACWGDRFAVTRSGSEWVGNTKTGWKAVTSVGGSTTGLRGDRLLLDDLNNPKDVESDDVRKATTQFVREIMPDRLNDLERSAIINLQQRTHEGDATGVLFEHGQGYTKICVPALFDPLRIFPVVLRTDEDGEPVDTWVDPRSLDADGKQLRGLTTNKRGEVEVIPGSPMALAEGESFWPERFSVDTLLRLKAEKGAYAWSCNPGEAPLLMADMSMKRLDQAQIGDEIVGFETGCEPRREGERFARRRLVRTKILDIHAHIRPVVRITLDSGRVIRCTADHKWFTGRTPGDKTHPLYAKAKVGRPLLRVCDAELPHLEGDDLRAAGWLAGFYEGEGTVCAQSRREGDTANAIISFAQGEKNLPICEELERVLTRLGFEWGFMMKRHADNPLRMYWLKRGGLPTYQRFLHIARPIKWRDRIIDAAYGSSFVRSEERVVSIQPDGEETVYGLTTGTGNYVVWGLASSNSQYDQFPGVRGGAIIRREWWRSWPGEYPAFGTVIASLDTAVEQGENNDFNAVTVWGAFAGEKGEPLLLMIAAWKMRATLAELVTRVAETCRERKVDYLLIEHKTRGRDVHDEIRRLYGAKSWETVLLKPEGDKESRLRAVSRLFSGDYRRLPDGGKDTAGRDTYVEVWSGGIVHAPDRDFADEVIAEVASFPYGDHDDYTDTVSQALGWVRRNGVVLHADEFEEQEMARNKFRRDPGVPYAIRRSR